MNFRKELILTLGTLWSFVFIGQDLSNYQSIEYKGLLPNDFLTHSSDKFENSLSQEISSSDERFTKKAKKSFLLMSSFELRDLLYNGKVLFNDTISNYVDLVAQEVLKNDSSLKNKIRFYVLKSSAVNGYATNDGMIFITMGMISQIENEAQLAYVLSHEIAHYKLKHVINGYVQNEKYERKHNPHSSRSRNELMIKQNRYSKELETEADVEGFKLFSKTKYKKAGVERVFDVLKYSYLPFDEIPFDTTIFQNEYYKFPESYWVDKLNPIAINDDYDEEKSTHPSPDKRKAKISKLVTASTDPEKGQYFQVKDENYFNYIQNVSRFELAKILLTEHEYEKAIYHIYLLQRRFEDNQYLDEMMSYAFYYLFRSDISSVYSLVNDSYYHVSSSDIEGQSNRVYYWLQAMMTKELGVLALKLALENKLKYPENKIFENISFDLMYLISREYDLNYDSFKKSFPLSTIEDRIVNEAEVSRKDKYYLFALVDIFASDKTLEKSFEKAKEVAAKTVFNINDKKILSNKEKRRIDRKGEAFGIDKLVIVSPEYEKINFKKKEPIEYGASEKSLLDLNQEFSDAASLANLELEILDNLTLKLEDVEKLNDLMFLNSWLAHSSRFLEKTETSFLVCLDEDRINDISEKYETGYYGWTGFTGVREKRMGFAPTTITFSAFSFTIPFGFYVSTASKNSMTYYLAVFDIKTKRTIWGRSEEYRTKDSDSVIRSILHDTFIQIKKTPKHKE